MNYVDRAKAMYERGEPARAAFMFANGLIREPDNDDALNWLLMLYVEKIESPGMERDVLRVLETQPDGIELYELIETRLAEHDMGDKIEALRKVRWREGLLPEPPPEPEYVAPLEPVISEPDESSTGHLSGETQPFDQDMTTASQDEEPVEAARNEWPDGTTPLTETGAEDWGAFEDPIEKEHEPESDGFRRTTATTGVYSSLDAISEDEARAELREYYEKRRKKQILIGLVIVALVAAGLLFLFPGEASESEESIVPDETSEQPQQGAEEPRSTSAPGDDSIIEPPEGPETGATAPESGD